MFFIRTTELNLTAGLQKRKHHFDVKLSFHLYMYIVCKLASNQLDALVRRKNFTIILILISDLLYRCF